MSACPDSAQHWHCSRQAAPSGVLQERVSFGGPRGLGLTLWRLRTRHATTSPHRRTTSPELARRMVLRWAYSCPPVTLGPHDVREIIETTSRARRTVADGLLRGLIDVLDGKQRMRRETHFAGLIDRERQRQRRA